MKRSFAHLTPFLALLLSASVLSAQTHSTPAEPPPSPSAAPSSEPPEGVSDVRIVRLSQATGEVYVNHNAGQGFEQAVPNLPITRGMRLMTGELGVAEVEFEDNSTLRLGPDTEVIVPELSRNDISGATTSTIYVVRGTAYASLEKSRGNTFTLKFRNGSALLTPSSRVRLDAGYPQSSFAVLQGAVEFNSYYKGPTVLNKRQELVFDPANQAHPESVVKVEEAPLDAWDKTEAGFHSRLRNASAFGGSPYLFGFSDLDYYGAFSDISGCGSVWRPYFAGINWDPYDNGYWAWYPGYGYSWVSIYPWGWAPFHFGDWQQCSNGSWGWRPGGGWSGLHNIHWHHHPGEHHHPFPHHPPHQPPPGRSTLIAVNNHPPVASRLDNRLNFVFHKDSAGLGIPRGMFGKLGKASSSLDRHGVAYASLNPDRSTHGNYGVHINRTAEAAALGQTSSNSWRSEGGTRSDRAYNGSSGSGHTWSNGSNNSSHSWSGSSSGGSRGGGGSYSGGGSSRSSGGSSSGGGGGGGSRSSGGSSGGSYSGGSSGGGGSSASSPSSSAPSSAGGGGAAPASHR